MNQKDKLAVCVVGYNRIDSTRRLLKSLQDARYDSNDVPLVISIDCSGDKELYAFVNGFTWQHGPKRVIIHEKRLGLKDHIISCGDLSLEYKGIIILEDDIFVSPEYYNYAQKAVDFYGEESRIGGISLFQDEMSFNSVIHSYYNDGSDAYLKQEPASWGELWTSSQWMLFKEWMKGMKENVFDELDMPMAYKNRKKAWSKYFMAYLIQTNRYVVYPHLSHSTCFGDTGEHTLSISFFGQVNLLAGPHDYHFKHFDEMTKYDIYDVNLNLYEWLGYAKEDLCIDWYGMNPNFKRKRYLLTPRKMPYKVIKSYGLFMRPIELNIKYNIEGDGLYLYDTVDGNYNLEGKNMPLRYSFYHMRSFNYKIVTKYLLATYLLFFRRGVKKLLK